MAPLRQALSENTALEPLLSKHVPALWHTLSRPSRALGRQLVHSATPLASAPGRRVPSRVLARSPSFLRLRVVSLTEPASTPRSLYRSSTAQPAGAGCSEWGCHFLPGAGRAQGEGRRLHKTPGLLAPGCASGRPWGGPWGSRAGGACAPPPAQPHVRRAGGPRVCSAASRLPNPHCSWIVLVCPGRAPAGMLGACPPCRQGTRHVAPLALPRGPGEGAGLAPPLLPCLLPAATPQVRCPLSSLPARYSAARQGSMPSGVTERHRPHEASCVLVHRGKGGKQQQTERPPSLPSLPSPYSREGKLNRGLKGQYAGEGRGEGQWQRQGKGQGEGQREQSP